MALGRLEQRGLDEHGWESGLARGVEVAARGRRIAQRGFGDAEVVPCGGSGHRLPCGGLAGVLTHRPVTVGEAQQVGGVEGGDVEIRIELGERLPLI